MPTVLRLNGFDVCVYTHDHPPGHVHVLKAGAEVVINLGDAETSPSMREVKGMSKKDARQAVTLVEDHRDALLAEWRGIHG